MVTRVSTEASRSVYGLLTAIMLASVATDASTVVVHDLLIAVDEEMD
jgi:hypothetical protein